MKIEPFDSVYRLILIASERAKQIKMGSPPRIKSSLIKPYSIALEEILHHKVWVRFKDITGRVVEIGTPPKE